MNIYERAAGRNPAPSGAGQGQLSFQSDSLPEGESHCPRAGVLQFGVSELATERRKSLSTSD